MFDDSDDDRDDDDDDDDDDGNNSNINSNNGNDDDDDSWNGGGVTSAVGNWLRPTPKRKVHRRYEPAEDLWARFVAGPAPPDSLCCPITMELFRKPVRTP